MAKGPVKRPPPQPAASGHDCLALHRNTAFEWHPSTVTALSACPPGPTGNLLAVGYESGDLELWDMQLIVCLQRIMAPGAGAEVTSCTWASDGEGDWRLFASLIDGSLVEVCWRLGDQAPTDSFGGTVWCLATKPHVAGNAVIAAACDDGGLRLFEAEAGTSGLSLQRVLARVEGRLLCASWSPAGDTVYAAGASGIIHVLPVTSGTVARRITVSVSSSQPVLVWRLLTLADGTLVSGDSAGAVQFWDGAFGTLVNRFQRHTADVLALAAASDGASVFASGVDSKVVQFTRLPGGQDAAAAAGQLGQWTYTHFKRPHMHDVRALAVASGHRNVPVLISGSVDGTLVASPVNTFLQEHPVRLTRCPQRPICLLSRQHDAPSTSAPRHARVMVAQGETIDVMQLAASKVPSELPTSSAKHEGDVLDLLAPSRHLAQIKLGAGWGRIQSAAMSPDGTRLAVSSGRRLRCYSLGGTDASGGGTGQAGRPQDGGTAADAAASVSRLPTPQLDKPAVAVAMTDDVLAVAHPDGCLSLINLRRAAGQEAGPSSEGEGAAAGVLVRVPCHPGFAERHGAAVKHGWRRHVPALSLLVTATNGEYVAAAGPSGVAVYELPSGTLVTKELLPQGDGSPVAALAFSHDAKSLAVVTSSGVLRVYDMVAGGTMSEWSVQHQEAVDALVTSLPGSPIGLSFNPAAQCQQLLVYTPSAVVHLNLALPLAPPHTEGKKRRGVVPSKVSPTLGLGSNGRVVVWEHPVVFLAHAASDVLLALEKPWEDVLRSLPLPLHRHIYGT